MTNVRDTLRELAEVDRPGAVWCAVLCAATVRHLMPVAALPALRLSLLWAQGVPVSESRLRRADDDAFVGNVALASARVDASASAYAALDSASGYAALSIASACASVDYAALALAASGSDSYATAYGRLRGLVKHQTTPLPHPGDSPLGDWLLEHDRTGRRVGTLGESLAWARVHRLRWWVPEQRWAAEHRIEIPATLRPAVVA